MPTLISAIPITLLASEHELDCDVYKETAPKELASLTPHMRTMLTFPLSFSPSYTTLSLFTNFQESQGQGTPHTGTENQPLHAH